MKETMSIYWKGELIGYLSKPELDMWYISGEWQSIDNDISTEFVEKMSSLNCRDFWETQNVEDYVWVGLDENKANALFVCFLDEFITIRQVFAIEPPENW